MFHKSFRWFLIVSTLLLGLQSVSSAWAAQVSDAVTTYSDATVTRFNANGLLDTTFGTPGTPGTCYAPWSGLFNDAKAIAIQSDGKIVIAGSASPGGASAAHSSDFFVARCNANGMVDTSFNSPHGHVRVDFANGLDLGSAIALTPDGKIVVVGKAWNGSRDIWGIARLNSNGGLDNTFDNDGKAYVDFYGSNAANAVVVQPDGKIIVGGSYNGDFFIQRLLTNGSRDPNYGINGAGYNYVNLGINDVINALALDSNGRLYAAGHATQSSDSNFAVARFTSTGLLDTTFNSGLGYTGVDFAGGADNATSIALTPDGKLVVAGNAVNNFGTVWGVIRLNTASPAGTLDQTFGDGGRAYVNFINDNGANAVVVQPDGKIIVGGYYNGDLFIQRLLTNGSRDPNYGINGGGYNQVDLGRDDKIYAMALDSSGRLYAAGESLQP